MMARRRKSRLGYTILEIVVVIGITAAILALCVPLIGFAIQKALSAKCMANQHQIYVAIQQYSTENGGAIPVMLPMRASVNDPGPTLDITLAPYITDPSIFHCPADKTVYAQSGCSYLWVYGYSVDAQGQQNTNLSTPTLLGLTNPGQVPFVSDKQSFHSTSPGSHIVYADGHVQ